VKCSNGSFNSAAAFIGLHCVGLRIHQAGVGRPETETKDVEVCVHSMPMLLYNSYLIGPRTRAHTHISGPYGMELPQYGLSDLKKENVAVCSMCRLGWTLRPYIFVIEVHYKRHDAVTYLNIIFVNNNRLDFSLF